MSVGIETRVRAGRPGFNSQQGAMVGFFSSSPPQDRLWGLLSLLSNGWRGIFPLGWSGLGAKLTAYLRLVLSLRIRGAIPPLLRYVFVAWCFVNHKDNFIVTLHDFKCSKLRYKISFICWMPVRNPQMIDQVETTMNGTNDVSLILKSGRAHDLVIKIKM
jgi:hypothetical protein